MMMPTTALKELYNLRRYIQHLILESEYEYDDDDFDNPLNEDNWLFQNKGKFMKYVIYNRKAWTHKHLEGVLSHQLPKLTQITDFIQMKRSLTHLQDLQNVQYMAHLLHLQKVQFQFKHLKFQLSLSDPDMMTLIHQ